MAYRCALCGAGVERQVTPPPAWEAYLVAERGMEQPAGALVLPVCRSCHARVAEAAETAGSTGTVTPGTAADLPRAAVALLDDVALARLVDCPPS